MHHPCISKAPAILSWCVHALLTKEDDSGMKIGRGIVHYQIELMHQGSWDTAFVAIARRACISNDLCTQCRDTRQQLEVSMLCPGRHQTCEAKGLHVSVGTLVANC